MFRIGQQVTQIKPIAWPTVKDETHPQFGVVYTIRTIDLHEGKNYLRFSEIRNPVLQYLDGTFEMCYLVNAFRPIVSRKTDISIFHRILRSASHKELT